ncbi:response regulator [Sphingomonas sp. SRS2]|uniref:response regulator n=1 Tax=Sphingomonas sp. SRS2 TaxID=133190 RepID=UPI000697DD62|nr:response regulator [Sphingomonas sp. SRS2]
MIEPEINVLVIDDSLVIRAMLAGLFEKDRRLNVVGVAASAEEATAILRERQVDVVTLDIDMPGTDGLTYLQTLNARHVPAVMLSGSTAEGSETRIGALMLGAAACFNKADTMKNANALIQLIKAAALNQVKLSRTDAAALLKAKQEALRGGATA